MKLSVAIPKYGEEIAPCFESASRFLIAGVDGKQITSRAIFECTGCEGFDRVRLLKRMNIDWLICDGIKNFYLDLIRSMGIAVMSNVTTGVEEALNLCLLEKLTEGEKKRDVSAEPLKIPYEDMMCWTKDLFRSHGYKVSTAADIAPFPIDLIAEMRCPLCHKPVRVAICCGSHTYRIDQELVIFRRVASTDFHAKVYIYPANPATMQLCQEYGIELIEPGAEIGLTGKKGRNIPLLRQPVTGHERASGIGKKVRRPVKSRKRK